MLEKSSLPNKWELVTLESVISPRKEKILPGEMDGRLYIGLEHITSNNLNIINFGSSEGLKSTKGVFYKEDILYGKLRPYLNKVVLCDRKGVCSTDIIVFQVKKDLILTKYIANILRSNSFLNFATMRMSGANLPRVSWPKLKNFKILLPPLETQKKIVETLEKAEKLKEWRTEADELTDGYLKSLFLEMFGNPFKNPFEFPSKKIKEVVDLINGRAFKPDEWEETGLKIIRIQNLNKPDSEYNFYSKEIDPKFIVNNGDLLLSWSGTPGTSFGVFIWQGETAVLNQHIFNVKFKTNSLNKYYFQFFINQKLIELISKSHGGVGLKHITKSKLNEVDIYVPPLELQNQFAQIVQQVETLKTHQSQSKKQIDNLFNTLMQKAFKGELVC